MKVLFLDFDGVLNSHRWWSERTNHGTSEEHEFDPKPCNMLKQMLEADSELHIVVSSSWRVGRSLDQLRDLLSAYVEPSRLIGKTDEWMGKYERGFEIQKWLDENRSAFNVTSFAIVDDDSDMVHLSPRHVKTSFGIGMQQEHVDKLTELLKETS